jgi:hypothetical protein
VNTETLEVILDDFASILAHNAVTAAMRILQTPWAGATGAPRPAPPEVRLVAQAMLAIADQVEAAFLSEIGGDSSESTQAIAFSAVESASHLAVISLPSEAAKVNAWAAELEKIALAVLRDGNRVRCARIALADALAGLAIPPLTATKNRAGVRVPVGGFEHTVVPTVKQ